jgi:transglutaminase-like putative cysteine protease
MDKKYLLPTPIIDSDHRTIIEYAENTISGTEDSIERAVKLYYAVRDGIWYTPYCPFYLAEHYRASNVLKGGKGFCVCKASLLCALGRACGIPSRVGFASVRNHLATKELIEFMGSDLFIYHGFIEFYLEGKWIKATPAFNVELCKRHRVAPLEFNGREDSIFQPYNLEERKFMDYVAYLGTYADIPLDTIVAAWEDFYGQERVRSWIAMYEKSDGIWPRDFDKEEVWKGESDHPADNS